MTDATIRPELPDRLSVNPRSKFYDAAIFEHEGQLYFLRSLQFADYTEFWRFDPDGF